jgi:glutathione S-transferase
VSLVLYHSVESACSQKVRLVLSEKRLEWFENLLNLRKGDQFASEYLKLNPKAVVPTLVHDGRVIRESSIINEYVDQVFREPTLKPTDPYLRACMRLLVKIFDDDVHPSVGVLVFATALRHQMKEMKSPEELKEHLRQIADPKRRERQRLGLELGLKSPAAKEAIATLRKVIGEMETRLTDNPWLAGEAYTLADAAAAPYIVRIDAIGLSRMWGRTSAIPDWLHRVEAREAYRRLKDPWGSASFREMVTRYATRSSLELEELLQETPEAQ